MERLILDTCILINAVRGQLELNSITDESDPSVPAITIAEFLVGAELDDNPVRAASVREFLARILGVLPVEEYTAEVAQHHAVLLAHLRRTGRSLGAHDLVIAATARATNRILVTTDAKAQFGELPGVQARMLRT